MNPLLLDHNILTLLVSLGVVGGFLRIVLLDLRYLVTHDRDIVLTLMLLVLLVASSRSWNLLPDMLLGAGFLGCMVLGIKVWFGRKFGSGDCLVYPICGFAVGMESMFTWTLFVSGFLIVMPLCWARYRGKRIWPLRGLRRIVFPATPPAILALFITWGVEVVFS